jgi:3-hydroxyacyl-[acyl-carrier-protein] dehydratase
VKFRLIDRITSWTPHERICGTKAVSFEEYSLKDAFGDEARLPEMLLLESFLQLGNWLILLSSDYARLGMLAKLAEVRFHDFLRPGQTVRLEVNLRQQRDDGFVLTGEGRVRGRPIITGLECLAVSVPAAEYVEAGDLRVLFSEIYQPEAGTVE